ncbi:MAG: tail fiber domain-containing protein [Phycisphaerae bacterium]
MRAIKCVLSVCAVLLLTPQTPVSGQPPYPMGTAFTYQGQLNKDGSPVTDTCDFEFSLWDDATDGTQKGSTVPATTSVEDGLFTVELDFGEQFNGQARWLQIKVCCPSPCTPVLLAPRQELTPTPYALALPGLWTQQNTTSPNLIGGYSGNVVTPGVVGATISGGGKSGFPNSVTGDFGTVGGGQGNTASDSHSTVGGGLYNNATGPHSTVGGGEANHATAGYSTVGGGALNTAGGQQSTVPGGWGNRALGRFSFAAGYNASADHDNTFVWASEEEEQVTSTGPNQFIIRASGGVGIGTNSPSQQLHVHDGAIFVTATNNEIPGMGGPMILLGGGTPADPNGRWGIEYEPTAEGLNFWKPSPNPSGWGNYFLFLADNGNVGIGTEDPSELLDVAGNIHASGTITSGSSITIDGTANTINSTGNLDLQTTATSRVFIDDSTGNVGIATTNPAAELDLIGQIKITDGTEQVDRVLTCVAATGLAEWKDAPAAGADDDWAWSSGSGLAGDIYHTGNVGIGTTTPDGKLHVDKDICVTGSSAARVTFSNVIGCGSISTRGLSVESLSIPNPVKGTQIGIEAKTGVHSINNSQDGDTLARLAESGGYDAIGTFIGVRGTSTPRKLKAYPDNTTNALGGRFVVSPNAPLAIVDAGGTFWIGGSYNEVVGTFNWSPPPNRGAIAAVIGIDNNAGSAESYAGYFKGKVVVKDLPLGGGTDVVMVDSEGLLHTATKGLFDDGWSGAGTGQVYATKLTDNVGIGTMTPTERLHVVGNISVTGAYLQCSDARLKNNTTRIVDSLDTLSKLRGVRFDWKRDEFPDHNFSEETQVGLVAQEVKTVLPEVVSKGSDGFYSVDYGRVTPVMVEAINELHTMIDRKDAQIASLEARLAVLEGVVGALAQSKEGGAR